MAEPITREQFLDRFKTKLLPEIAELKEIDGALWARIPPLNGRCGAIQILSHAEIAANSARENGILDEIERLRAALKAQEDASVALNGRVGYEEYQALQDKADGLRRQALAVG